MTWSTVAIYINNEDKGKLTKTGTLPSNLDSSAHSFADWLTLGDEAVLTNLMYYSGNGIREQDNGNLFYKMVNSKTGKTYYFSPSEDNSAAFGKFTKVKFTIIQEYIKQVFKTTYNYKGVKQPSGEESFSVDYKISGYPGFILPRPSRSFDMFLSLTRMAEAITFVPDMAGYTSTINWVTAPVILNPFTGADISYENANKALCRAIKDAFLSAVLNPATRGKTSESSGMATFESQTWDPVDMVSMTVNLSEI